MRVAIAAELFHLLQVKNVEMLGSHAKIHGKPGNYSVHMGSAVTRMEGKPNADIVENCWSTATIASNNALVFSQLNEGTVTASADLSHMDAAQKNAFWKTCGWDFTKVWDSGNGIPILRSCDSAAQRKGQA